MSESAPNPQPSGMFAEPPVERGFPAAAVAIAAVAIAILAVVLVLLGRRGGPPLPDPTKLQPLAAYAANLEIGHIEMSEADVITGGKSTYIDGHIVNHGTATVTGIAAQVLFANDQGTPPQMELTPLYLVRTREPYVDTEPVSAAPLAPGAGADFRLTFENVNSNWNLQPPAIHIIAATTRK
jgi:hypothetical protein